MGAEWEAASYVINKVRTGVKEDIDQSADSASDDIKKEINKAKDIVLEDAAHHYSNMQFGLPAQPCPGFIGVDSNNFKQLVTSGIYRYDSGGAPGQNESHSTIQISRPRVLTNWNPNISDFSDNVNGYFAFGCVYEVQAKRQFVTSPYQALPIKYGEGTVVTQLDADLQDPIFTPIISLNEVWVFAFFPKTDHGYIQYNGGKQIVISNTEDAVSPYFKYVL